MLLSLDTVLSEWIYLQGIDISESSVWDKVLLLIEKQAVIQLLLQQLATYFDPKDAQKLQGVSTCFRGSCDAFHVLYFLFYIAVHLQNGERGQLPLG